MTEGERIWGLVGRPDWQDHYVRAALLHFCWKLGVITAPVCGLGYAGGQLRWSGCSLWPQKSINLTLHRAQLRRTEIQYPSTIQKLSCQGGRKRSAGVSGASPVLLLKFAGEKLPGKGFSLETWLGLEAPGVSEWGPLAAQQRGGQQREAGHQHSHARWWCCSPSLRGWKKETWYRFATLSYRRRVLEHRKLGCPRNKPENHHTLETFFFKKKKKILHI